MAFRQDLKLSYHSVEKRNEGFHHSFFLFKVERADLSFALLHLAHTVCSCFLPAWPSLSGTDGSVVAWSRKHQAHVQQAGNKSKGPRWCIPISVCLTMGELCVCFPESYTPAETAFILAWYCFIWPLFLPHGNTLMSVCGWVFACVCVCVCVLYECVHLFCVLLCGRVC